MARQIRDVIVLANETIGSDTSLLSTAGLD